MTTDDSTLDGPSLLSERDVRDMVYLIGEVAALPGGHAEKKKYLLNGLCRLIDADFWYWTLAAEMVPGKAPVFVGGVHDGYGPGQFAAHMLAHEHPEFALLTLPLTRELAEKRAHLTRNHIQVDPEMMFTRSEVGRLFGKADVGTLLVSFRPIESESWSCIAIFRRGGRPEFDARTIRIAHIVLSEVPWLHEQGWPKPELRKAPSLASRHFSVLNLLLEGMDRKSIAAGMGISVNTVNDYVKEIYRHYRVNSQARLLRKFTVGDGGDRPA